MKLIKVALEAAQAKKATEISLVDLRGKSDVCDFHLLLSGDNEKQTSSIANSIEQKCKETLQLSPSAIEGKTSGHWILLDYGSVIVHIFLKEVRDYYALEELWPDSLVSPDDFESL